MGDVHRNRFAPASLEIVEYPRASYDRGFAVEIRLGSQGARRWFFPTRRDAESALVEIRDALADLVDPLGPEDR